MKLFSLLLFVLMLLWTSEVASAGMQKECPAGQRLVQSSAPIISDGCNLNITSPLTAADIKRIKRILIKRRSKKKVIDYEEEDKFQFAPCCDLHQACYKLCNSDRDQCDSSFRACTLKVCKQNKKVSKGKVEKKDKDHFEQCQMRSSDLLDPLLSEDRVGELAFAQAQQSACECVNVNQIPKQYLAHAESILARGIGFEKLRREKFNEFQTSLLEMDTSRPREEKYLYKLFKENVKGIERRVPPPRVTVSDEEELEDL